MDTRCLRGCREDSLIEAQLRTASLLSRLKHGHVAYLGRKRRCVSLRLVDQLGIEGHDTSDSDVNFCGQEALLHHLLLLLLPH